MHQATTPLARMRPCTWLPQVSSNSCPDYDPASTSFLGSVLSSLNNLEAGLVEASTQGSGTEIADDVAVGGSHLPLRCVCVCVCVW